MKPLHYLFLALVAACLSSCFSLTEEIHLSPDGSGDYKMYAEMDTSMDLSKLFAALGTKDSTMKELVSKMGSLNKDSLQDILKNNTVEYSFKDAAALTDFKNEIFKKKEEMDKSKKSSGAKSEGGFEIAKIRTKFKLKKNVFSRSTKFSGGEGPSKDDNQVYKAMAGAAKVKTIIYLPKKVKTIKTNGTITERDEKKVVLEFPLIDYMTGQKNDNFEITME